MTDRLWLDVPYSEKDAAKAAGARWDRRERRWYAPDRRQSLQEWAPKPPLPTVLPGEDRTFGSGLFVDLVPDSCWFTNVRYCISTRDWDRVRRMVYGRANNSCESCGQAPDRDQAVTLQAHERWDFNERDLVQTLKRLVCLCSRCHEATHFGYAQIKGTDRRALEHLMRVNNWTRAQARSHVDKAFRIWRRRSMQNWTLDLSVLTSAGVTLARPPEAAERRAIAARKLKAV